MYPVVISCPYSALMLNSVIIDGRALIIIDCEMHRKKVPANMV